MKWAQFHPSPNASFIVSSRFGPNPNPEPVDDPRSVAQVRFVPGGGSPVVVGLRQPLGTAASQLALTSVGCGFGWGVNLGELESLGVDGRHWETSGDTDSGCWKGLE